mmetsp:Transcript_4672/g.13711  ORF Transcript_4672/g.13711 Transcript_4672/m.13711 type:complete len:252 (-) Transcript_4672:1594-2349(-)
MVAGKPVSEASYAPPMGARATPAAPVFFPGRKQGQAPSHVAHIRVEVHCGRRPAATASTTGQAARYQRLTTRRGVGVQGSAARRSPAARGIAQSVLHHADSSTSLYTSSFISHSRLSPAPAFRKRLNGLVNFTPPTRIMEFTLNMVLSASCTYRRSVSLPVTQPRKENQWPRTTCQPFSKVCPAKTTSFSSTSATPLRRANQTGPSILISSSATRKATIWSAESVLANSARVEDCDGRTLLCCTRQFCSRM